MKFANGDIEEINALIPNLVELVFDMSKLKPVVLPSNFDLAGIETPYLVKAYSLFATKALFTAFIVVPLLYLIFLKWPKSAIATIGFQFLFFNGILRILLEVYIDACLEVFLNARYLTFSNNH